MHLMFSDPVFTHILIYFDYTYIFYSLLFFVNFISVYHIYAVWRMFFNCNFSTLQISLDADDDDADDVALLRCM